MKPSKSGEIDAGDLKFEPASLEQRVAHARVTSPIKTMEELEAEAIDQAVARHHGDRKAAAKELKIGYSTLRRNLLKRGIVSDD